MLHKSKLVDWTENVQSQETNINIHNNKNNKEVKHMLTRHQDSGLKCESNFGNNDYGKTQQSTRVPRRQWTKTMIKIDNYSNNNGTCMIKVNEQHNIEKKSEPSNQERDNRDNFWIGKPTSAQTITVHTKHEQSKHERNWNKTAIIVQNFVQKRVQQWRQRWQ